MSRKQWCPMQKFNLSFKKATLAPCVLLLFLFGSAQASPSDFKDPIDTPATKIGGTLKLDQQPISAMATLKGRIIAVGLRGIIVLSDDGGATWRQAQVPIQSDLTAVTFPSPTRGWAVGHDGVILTTSDAGESWIKQLDGKIAATLFTEFYQKRVDAGDASMQHYLDQARLNAKNPAALPYLSVYFENEQTGYAVGSFGSILVTQDGGKTWEPWMHHIDNDQFLNLNDIRRIGSTLYIAGERGGIWKFDKTKQRFNSISIDYRGSFFSIAGKDDKLLVVGLGGTAFRSADGGATWQGVVIGTQATLTAIINTHDGLSPLIISLDGELFTSDADWKNFRPVPVEKPMAFASSLAVDESGQIILAGYRGLWKKPMQPVLSSHQK